MKFSKKRILCLMLITIFLVPSVAAINSSTMIQSNNPTDFDPLVDITVTVEIKKIRSFDKNDQQVRVREYIDSNSDPDFFVKIIINNQEFLSDIWYDTKYIYNPEFSATLDVPDNEEFVNVKIQLWDWNDDGDVLCDIGNENNDVELSYSIKTGHWTGDDYLKDPSGYGRLNGCDDGSIYKRDRDCELWFDIYQNDYDGDGIPYWTEVNTYGTNPETKDVDDYDEDGIPIQWEWKWEYDPFSFNDHKKIDPENDGIDNIEEYLTSQWDSDPFRKDLFIELDQMEESPSGEKSLLPEGSKELLYTAYDRQNVVYHLDDCSWEDSGSDMIPYDEETNHDELDIIYWNYFLHGDEDIWRRGVFHYGLITHGSNWVAGAMFGPDCFYITSRGHENKATQPFMDRDTVFASAFMHETGHTLGFRRIPGHDRDCCYPWQLGWWINRPYKSCMNYGYMYTTVDYSDGSRPIIDLDDWERMDLTAFQRRWD